MASLYLSAVAPFVEKAGQALFRFRVPLMVAAGLVAGAANAEAASGSSSEDLGDVVEKVWKVIEAKFTNGEQDCELLVHNIHDGTPTDTKITFSGEDVGRDEVGRACNYYDDGRLAQIKAHELAPETATSPGKYAGISIRPYQLTSDPRPAALVLGGTGAFVLGMLGLGMRGKPGSSIPP